MSEKLKIYEFSLWEGLSAKYWFVVASTMSEAVAKSIASGRDQFDNVSQKNHEVVI